MTKIFRTAAAGVAMFAAVGMGSAAHAQQTESADATATVLAALQLTNDADLDFGNLVVSGAGTSTVTAGGSRSCTADVTCAAGGSEAAAAFTVTGDAGTTVSVTVQDPTAVGAEITLVHSANAGSTNNEHNIELTSLVDNSGGSYTNFSGSETFEIGGTIALDGSEIAGTYSASFDVTVEYQ